jgi:predicted CXXCH cytochrome family protein
MHVSYIILMSLLLFPLGRKLHSVFYEPRNEDCISCHSDLIKNTVVHPQLESTCDICHASTGEVHPKSNVKGFSLTEKLPVLCFNCHSDFQEHFDSYPSVHGAVKDSASCINCHNPHSSPLKKLLINESNDLCLRCHDKTIAKDSVRISNIKQVLSRAKSVHPPVENGGCVTCHNPHFSEKRALLTGNFPSGQYVKATLENFELCFMCHDSDLLEKQITEAGTNFRNGTQNLHFVHVNGDKGRNCTMCHGVHGAVNDRLIVDKLRFGSWEMKISFKTTENGGSCLTACHSERKYDRTIPPKTGTIKPVRPESESSRVAGKVAYVIQLMAAQEHLKMSRFKGIDGVREINSEDGYYRYVYGEYSSSAKAKTDLTRIQESGFKNAFVKKMSSLNNK